MLNKKQKFFISLPFVFLLLCIGIVSWNAEDDATDVYFKCVTVPHEQHARTRRVVLYEGCEYLESFGGMYNSTPTYSFAHKGDCKNPLHGQTGPVPLRSPGTSAKIDLAPKSKEIIY